MISFSKVLFTNPAQIRLSGIYCNYDNIINIFSILDFQCVVFVIDHIPDNSPFLMFINKLGLKHTIKQCTVEYTEVSIVVPHNLFGAVLYSAIQEDPENIVIFNLLDLESWDTQLCRSGEALVAGGTTNLFISIAPDENAVLILVNKFLVSPKTIYQRIKALRFNNAL